MRKLKFPFNFASNGNKLGCELTVVGSVIRKHDIILFSTFPILDLNEHTFCFSIEIHILNRLLNFTNAYLFKAEVGSVSPKLRRTINISHMISKYMKALRPCGCGSTPAVHVSTGQRLP